MRLRVRRDDGAELEAVAVGVDVPSVGERVAVEVDPDGVVEVPVWRLRLKRARLRRSPAAAGIRVYSHSIVAGGFEREVEGDAVDAAAPR